MATQIQINTDRHGEHSDTNSTNGPILLPSVVDQDEDALLGICIHTCKVDSSST